MIRFACRCGNGLELPDDEAGGMIQCPRCGRLNDVPNHSDLLSLAPDGTYGLDAGGPVGTDPHRLADISLVYARTKHDEQGNEIDLRTLPPAARRNRGPAERGGEDEGELDLKPPDEPVKVRPRYDPETGELIRDLALAGGPDAPPVDPSTIPMAKAAINYASGNLARRVSPWKIFVELWMPLNVAVMFSILLLHLFNGLLFVTSVRLIFTWPVLLILQGLILAHYGNVIDEVGRNEHDELPRPMGDFSFYDDMWAPFVHMFGGLMIAYVPPLALAAYLPGPEVVWSLLALGVGTVVAPALLLTTNTSGATENLRPDRVLGVMRVSGLHYVGAVLIWAVAWPVYLIGWIGFCFWTTALFGAGVGGGILSDGVVVLPCLGAGIYLMHLFSWYMGLIYRAHHAEFPWVLQRHVRDPNAVRPRGTHANQLGRRRVGRGDPVALPSNPHRPAAEAAPLPLAPPPATPVAAPPPLPDSRVRRARR